jgi:Polyketide cyclase / dehydrase and lipid transport
MLAWIVGAIVAALGVLLVAARIVGGRLPRGHVAAARAHYARSPEVLWATITNLADAPNWRSGLRQVERLADRNGRQVWIEVTRTGRMPIVFEVVEPPRRLVIRILDEEKLPFGGTWTFEIEPQQDGATLTIRENGEIYNPMFRFMGRYVFGYEGPIRKYLQDLGKKLGEKVQPVRIPVPPSASETARVS